MNKLKLALESAGKIIKNAVLNGKVRTDDETKKERLRVCHRCSSFWPNNNMCKECGCFMELKAGLLSMRCPLGKW